MAIHKNTLRESVSSFIISGTNTINNNQTFTTNDVYYSNTTTLDNLFNDTKSQQPTFLGKRSFNNFNNLPLSTSHQTVAPNKIFSEITSYLPKKKQKLYASTDFLNFPIESPQFENYQEINSFKQENEDPIKQENNNDEEKGEQEFPFIKNSPVNKQEIQEEEEELTTTTSIEDIPSDKKQVSVTVNFGIRGNGNQPWNSSVIGPPKIGKMRRVTVNVKSKSLSPHPVQLRVTSKDLQENLHNSKLVFCKDDRCCTKTKIPGRSKPHITCKDRKNLLLLPERNISKKAPTSFDVFLKPEWNGLGTNKIRPSFNVSIELIDCITQTVYPILTFETELQSHKFESSRKAKQMETSLPHTCSAVKLVM